MPASDVISTRPPGAAVPKLLELLVHAGALSREGQAFVLARQRRLERREGKKVRVGELLRQLGLVTSSDIESAAARQGTTGSGGGGRGPVFRKRPSPLGVQARVWVIALIVFALAQWVFEVPVGVAASVCAFLATAVCCLVQYRIDHRWSLSLYHVARVAFPILAAIATVYMTVQVVMELGRLEQAHTLSVGELRQLEAELRAAGDDAQIVNMDRLRRWVLGLQVTVGALAVMLALAMLYGLWKYRAQRIVESRSSLLEGLMVRLRECIAERSKAVEQRRADALDIILETVRNWTRLNAWDSLREKMPLAWRGPLETAVYYFVPEYPEPAIVAGDGPGELAEPRDELADAGPTTATEAGAQSGQRGGGPEVAGRSPAGVVADGQLDIAGRGSRARSRRGGAAIRGRWPRSEDA